ncbi:hypothetical protein NDU88_005254, partial [Pleurodeles waltl]
DWVLVKEARMKYKRALRDSKIKHKDKAWEELERAIALKDPGLFWKVVNRGSFRTDTSEGLGCNIAPEAWVIHFCSIFEGTPLRNNRENEYDMAPNLAIRFSLQGVMDAIQSSASN